MAENAHSTPAPTAALRLRIEHAVELLIAALDAHDGDPDLEPDVDREPDDAHGAAWSDVMDQRRIFPAPSCVVRS